jgi:hypothetical protein
VSRAETQINYAFLLPNPYLLAIYNNLPYLTPYRNRDSDGLRARRSVFDIRQGREISLYSTAARPALGPTQPPIQWVTGSIAPRRKAAGA